MQNFLRDTAEFLPILLQGVWLTVVVTIGSLLLSTVLGLLWALMRVSGVRALTLLSGGLINMKIEPEVSQLDPSNVLQVGSVTLPSLIVRRANTTIELRDGQSFAMAGLLQNTGTTNQKQLPWIGEVPVLGALFRSAQYQKKETDLAIIVTPHIVRPTRPGDTVRAPTDSSLPANDADFFLLGQSELPPSMQRRVDGVARPLAGHILDLSLGGSYAQR